MIPVVTDKLKRIEFDDNNIQGKISHSREEEKKYIGISNESKGSVYGKKIRDYKQSIFQDLEGSHRTKKTEKADFKFILKIRVPFETYEIAPRILQVSDNKNASKKY